ncbi:MAG: alpha/beta hydrolase, partial [Deltaproteobacteria bacterium]|nr:alpha/beta hydrolase [Deltaproteobacteria bacterium]
TGVADRITEKVRRLVYLDAFVPEDGKCQMDYMPEAQNEALRTYAAAHDNALKPIPAENFRVNANDAAWVDRMCVPHPIHTFDQPLKQHGGIAKLRNRRVLIWAEGRAEAPFKQFYDVIVKDENWITYKVPCGHEIMIDMPDELVRILLEVA